MFNKNFFTEFSPEKWRPSFCVLLLLLHLLVKYSDSLVNYVFTCLYLLYLSLYSSHCYGGLYIECTLKWYCFVGFCKNWRRSSKQLQDNFPRRNKIFPNKVDILHNVSPTINVFFLTGALRAEDCTVVSACIDTVCNHHTNLECVHGICTCSLPPYDIRE